MRVTRAALLVLTACRAQPAAQVSWQPPVEIAQGGGTKGPWQQNQSRFDYVDDPSVALADDDTAAVVWVDHRDKDVHFARFSPTGARVGAAVNISRTPDVFSWSPRLVVAGRDVFVVWQEIIFSGGSHGGDILFAHSRDGGVTFDTAINLSRSIGGDGKARIDAKRWLNGSLDLVRAPDGALYVAWTDYDGTLWFAFARDATTFSEPIGVAGTRELPARAPSLAVDERVLYLAWTVGERDDADIHVASAVPPGDGFGPPIIVARTPMYSDAPKLALAGDTLHIAYTESRGGPFDPADVVYSQLRGDAFAPPTTLGEGTFPSLAVDGSRVTIIWETHDYRGLMMTSGTAGRFTAPRLLENSRDTEGTNGSHEGRLMRKLAVRDGAIAVVNSALAHGKRSRVWLLRGAF
jgi:hypothetical protein